MTIATFLAPSQCYYHYPLAGMKMWLFVVDSRAPCLALAAVIQLYAMTIRVVEFSSGGYKIRKIFALESTYPKDIVEF